MVQKPYPDHIYEPIRIKIATSYIKQQLRKLLPGIRGKIWEKIDEDIDCWFDENVDVGGVRNFWNGFQGIAMGFKLKITLLQIITAENIKWRFEKACPLDNQLCAGEPLSYIDKKLSQDKPRAVNLRDFFAKKENQSVAKKWRKEFKKKAQMSESREDFPIIAEQLNYQGDLIYSIHDGNRRMVLSILEGKSTIPAYLGEYTTKKTNPKNYWISTSLLMDVLYYAKRAYNEEKKEIFGYYMGILKDMLANSESAKYEFKKRALTKKQPFRDEVLEAVGMLG